MFVLTELEMNAGLFSALLSCRTHVVLLSQVVVLTHPSTLPVNSLFLSQQFSKACFENFTDVDFDLAWKLYVFIDSRFFLIPNCLPINSRRNFVSTVPVYIEHHIFVLPIHPC